MTSISRFDGPIWEDKPVMFVPENLDKAGATRLAKRIEKYWAKQGKDVKCRIEAFDGHLHNRAYLWSVRSNMRGGLPR